MTSISDGILDDEVSHKHTVYHNYNNYDIYSMHTQCQNWSENSTTFSIQTGSWMEHKVLRRIDSEIADMLDFQEIC